MVIKLGGSLLADPRDGRLQRWCERLTGEWAGRAVVVPGGGPFADAVRIAQAHCHFGDDVAHRMALRAMDQCGLMLCDLFPGLHPADDPEALAGMAAGGRTPVWLPSRALDHSSALPRNWTVTSDSLAVWLAAHIGSPDVVLVKSCALPTGDPDSMASAGIVDPHLPLIARRCAVRVHLANAPDALPAF